MALIEAKSLIRLSRMRVMYPVDTETTEHSCEVDPFGEGSSKGPETAIIEPPDLHLPGGLSQGGRVGAEASHRRP